MISTISHSGGGTSNQQHDQYNNQTAWIFNELSPPFSPTHLHVSDHQHDNVSTSSSATTTSSTLPDEEHHCEKTGKRGFNNRMRRNTRVNFSLRSWLTSSSKRNRNTHLSEGMDHVGCSGGCSSCHTSSKSIGERKFNPKDYSLVYDQVLKDRECLEMFLGFLKMSRAEESLEFILACDEYRGYYNRWKRNCGCILEDESLKIETEIEHQQYELEKQVETRIEHLTKLINTLKKEVIEKFIQEEAEKELHRGPLKSQLLRNWQFIIDQYRELTKEETLKYSLIQLKTQREITLGISKKLDPNLLFKDLYDSVHLDLQVDLFPWFCKHPDLIYFLRRKGEEYTRSIAIKNESFNILDWRMKESDMKEKVIKKEHFYFGFSLLEDSMDWKVILDKDDMKASISKQLYTFDKNLASKMCLSKFSTTIPFPLSKVWNVWANVNNHSKLDPNYDIHVKECTSSSIDPFAYGVIDSVSKIPFLSLRKFRHIYTIIEEPSIDSIYMLGHSFQDEKLEKEEENESIVYMRGFFFYLFRNLKETNETRIDMCYYLDPKIFLSRLFNTFWVKQCKHFTKTIKTLTSSSAADAQHNDELNYNKILQFNKERNVSYFDSWVKLRKNQQC